MTAYVCDARRVGGQSNAQFTVASPGSIGEGNWSALSAIGWFFGRDLFDALGGAVPIGLM